LIRHRTNEEEKKAKREKEAAGDATTPASEEEDTYLGQDIYIYVYSGLTLLIFVVTKVRAIYFFQYCMKISINVHNRMFGSLVRAPTKFFDDNPSGMNTNKI
jgi:ATP-binding cassette subfamily C (CFTR/MRP) protein 4